MKEKMKQGLKNEILNKKQGLKIKEKMKVCLRNEESMKARLRND